MPRVRVEDGWWPVSVGCREVTDDRCKGLDDDYW
jgi:hypothetical protein